MTNDASERIESLKAGILGSVASGITFISTAIIIQVVQDQPVLNYGLIHPAIAFIAGFLFGVTYRYAIRQEQNPQLKQGVVFAFGLVRGLAQIDVGVTLQVPWISLAVMVAQSIIMFAVAAIVLDWATHQSWLKPLRTEYITKRVSDARSQSQENTDEVASCNDSLG